jgi:hypothetical protein
MTTFNVKLQTNANNTNFDFIKISLEDGLENSNVTNYNQRHSSAEELP